MILLGSGLIGVAAGNAKAFYQRSKWNTVGLVRFSTLNNVFSQPLLPSGCENSTINPVPKPCDRSVPSLRAVRT